MYQPSKHGRADYGSYMQVPWEAVSGLVEGDESKPLIEQRFARLVYSINPTQLNISGATIAIDEVGLKASDEVGVTSGGLNVHDASVLNAINNIAFSENVYSSVIQELSGDTYIAEALVGNALSASAWRIQKIEAIGTTTWVDAANFTQAATGDFSLLTYNP